MTTDATLAVIRAAVQESACLLNRTATKGLKITSSTCECDGIDVFEIDLGGLGNGMTARLHVVKADEVYICRCGAAPTMPHTIEVTTSSVTHAAACRRAIRAFLAAALTP